MEMETDPGAQIEKNMEYINSFGYKIVQNMATERKLPANLKKMEMARLIALHNAGARIELNHLLNDLKETRSRSRRLALTHPPPSAAMPAYGTTTAEADSASASPDQDDDDDDYTFDEDEGDDLIDKSKKTPRLARVCPPQPPATRVQRLSYGYDTASPSPSSPPTPTVNQSLGQVQGVAPGQSGVLPVGHPGSSSGPGTRIGTPGPQGLPGQEETPKPKKPTYRRSSGGSSNHAASGKRISKGGRIIKPRRDGSFVYPKMTHLQNTIPYPPVHTPSPAFGQNLSGEGSSYDAPHIPPAAGGFRPPAQYSPSIPIGPSLDSSNNLKSWSTTAVPQPPFPNSHPSTNLYPRSNVPPGQNSKQCGGGLSSAPGFTRPSPYSPSVPGFLNSAQTQCSPKLTQNFRRNMYPSYPAVLQNSDYKSSNVVNHSLPYQTNSVQKGADFSFQPNMNSPSSRLGGIDPVVNNIGNSYPSSPVVGAFESKRVPFVPMVNRYHRAHTGPSAIRNSQVVKPIPLLLPVISSKDSPPSGYIPGKLECFFNVRSQHLHMPLQLSPYWKPAKTNSVNSYNTPICFTSSSPGLYQEATHILPNPFISSGPCYMDSPFQPVLRPNMGIAQPLGYDRPLNVNYEVPPINFQSPDQSKQFSAGSPIQNHVQYGVPQHGISTYQESLQYQQSDLCSNIEQYSTSPSVHESYQNAWAVPEQQWPHGSQNRSSVQQALHRHQKPLQPPLHSKQFAHRKRQTPAHSQQVAAHQGNSHISEQRGVYQINHQNQHLSSLAKQDIDKAASVNHLNQLNDSQKHCSNSSTQQNIAAQQKPLHNNNTTQTYVTHRQGPPPKKPCYQTSRNTIQDAGVSGHGSELNSSTEEVVQKSSVPIPSLGEKHQLPFSEFRGQNNQLSFPLIYDYLTSAEKQLSEKNNQEEISDQSAYDLNGNITSSFIEDVVLPTLTQHGLTSKLQELVYQQEALEVSQNSNVHQSADFISHNGDQTETVEDYNLQRTNQLLQVHQVSSLLPTPIMQNTSPDSSEPQAIEMSSMGLHFEPSKQVYAELSPLDANICNENYENSSYAELLPVPFDNHGEESEGQVLYVAKAVSEMAAQPEMYMEESPLSVPKHIDITLEKVMNKDENTKQVVFECTDGTGQPEYMTLDVSHEEVLDSTVGTIPASPCTSDVGELNLLDTVEENEGSSPHMKNNLSHLSQVSTIPVSRSDLSTETASSISDYLSNNSPSQVTSDADYFSTVSHVTINRESGNLNDNASNMTTNHILSSEINSNEAEESTVVSEEAQDAVPGGMINPNTSTVQLPDSPKRDDNAVPSVSEPLTPTENAESIQCQVPVILEETSSLSDDSGKLRNVPSGSEFLKLSENNNSVHQDEVKSASSFISNCESEVPELFKIIKTESINCEEYLENQVTVETENNDVIETHSEQPQLNAVCVSDTYTQSQEKEILHVKDEPVDLTRDQTTIPSQEAGSSSLVQSTGEEKTSETSTVISQESINTELKSTDVNMNVISKNSSDSAEVLDLVSLPEDNKPMMHPENDLNEDNVHNVSPLLRSKSAGKTYPGKQVRQPVRCSPRTSGRPSPSYAAPANLALPFRSELPVHQAPRGRKPCRNEENGCPLELTSTQLLSHHLVCEYTFIECPAIGCEWNGIAKKLSNHVRETHRPAIGAGTDSRHTVSVHQIHQQQHLTFLREVSRKLFVVCIHAYGNDIYASIQYIASGRAEKPITATGTLEVIDFVGTPHAWRGMIGPIQQGLHFLRESGNCLQVTSQCLGAIPDSTITFHTNIRVNHSQHAASASIAAASANSDPIS